MFITENSILINSDLEKVYAIAETYPKFVSFYKEKTVLFENEDKMIVRISSSFYGKLFSWEGEGIKNRNKSINFTQTQGLLKGLKVTWIFENPECNMVRVIIRGQIDFRFFCGKIAERLFGRLLISGTITKILYSLKNAVEDNISASAGWVRAVAIV